MRTPGKKSNRFTDEEQLRAFHKKYSNSPVLCAYCSSPIPFEEFVHQWGSIRYFCQKTCQTKYKKKMKLDSDVEGFSSITEKSIYEKISSEYKDEVILHNVSDLVPQHEIDFYFPERKIVIEYNGTLHINPRYGDKKQKKTALNDKKKQRYICNHLNYPLIRVWTEIGLYSRPELFGKVVQLLVNKIGLVLQNPQSYFGYCIDIVVDRSENITEDTYSLKPQNHISK